MEIVDLTHVIYENMPVHPVMEQPKIKRVNTIDKDGYREASIQMYSHTGTHMDAPAHMIKDGKYLDELSPDSFIGEAFLIDFSDKKEKGITVDFLKRYESNIKESDFLIIKTGWSKFWGDKKYYKSFPALTKKSAEYLLGLKLKGVGVDAISIDPMDSVTFDVHKTLLGNGMVIVENLKNLDKLEDYRFTFSAMPLKTKKADGATVRAIAVLD